MNNHSSSSRPSIIYSRIFLYSHPITSRFALPDIDPMNAKLILLNETKRRKSDLLNMIQQEREDRQEVLTQLEKKWNTHVKCFRLRVEELQKKMTARQTKQREVLVEENTANSNALKDRGNSELTSLFDRSALDEKKIMSDFQQFADSRGDAAPTIMQMRNAELHKHQKKVAELKGNLENKVRELLAESEADHKKKFLKLEKHHHRRKAELKVEIRSLATTCHSRHEQLKIQRVRSHEEKFKQTEGEIRSRETAFRPKDGPVASKYFTETETNEKQSGNYEVGSASRQKRRKSLLMKTPTFMTVEIHNEGLNVSCRNEDFSRGDAPLIDQKESSSKISNDFIPFGFSARQFLHSILSGRIPNHGIIDHRLIHQVGLQGQIKCLVADMRVPTEVALSQRQRAKQGSGIEELSRRAEATKSTLSQDIKEETVGNEIVKRSLKTLEKAKQKLLHLRTQTDNYLKKEGGPDKANAHDNFKRLSKIFLKCEGVVKNAEKQHKINTQKLAVARAKRIKTTEEYKRVSWTNFVGCDCTYD